MEAKGGLSSMSELTDVRGETHGNYRKNCNLAIELVKETEHFLKDNEKFHMLRETRQNQVLFTLRNIHHKITRIATGDPNFADHWQDIMGYAELMALIIDSDRLDDKIRESMNNV